MIERFVLLVLLLLCMGGVVAAAETLAWSPWLTVPVLLPLAFALWVSLAERIGGLVQLWHLRR